MNRALPLAALALAALVPAPALACGVDPLFMLVATGAFFSPLASPVAQGVLHALSERSRHAAVWARRFGGLNLLLGLGWFTLLVLGGAPLLSGFALPGLILLASGCYGLFSRKARAAVYSTAS